MRESPVVASRPVVDAAGFARCSLPGHAPWLVPMCGPAASTVDRGGVA